MRRIAAVLRGFAAPAALVVLGLLAWRNTLDNGFVYDDEILVVKNEAILSLTPLSKFVKVESQYQGAAQSRHTWRPLSVLSHALIYQAAGLEPRAYHLANVLLHIINALLAYFLIVALFGSPLTAFCAALVFLLHPAQTEAVGWVSAQSNLLYLNFYLAAFILFLRSGGKIRSRAYGLSLLCFVLSLLSKESAASLPLVLGLSLFIPRPSKERTPAVSLLPYFAVAALFVLARALVLGQTSQTGYWAGGLWPQLLTMTKGFALYVKVAVLPHALSLEYLFPVKRFPDAEVLLCGALLAGLVVLGLRALKKEPALGFGLLLFFLALAPVSNIIPINTIINERYLYLSILGLGLVLGTLVERGRKIRALAFAGLCGIYLLTTMSRNLDWKDNRTLLAETLKTSPQSSRVHAGLGDALVNAGQWQEASREYRVALAIDLTGDPLLSRIAEFDSWDEAVLIQAAVYRKSLQLRVEKQKIFSSLGTASLRLGLARKAVGYFELARELGDRSAQTRNNLAVAYASAGDRTRAVAELGALLAENPGDVKVAHNLRLFGESEPANFMAGVWKSFPSLESRWSQLRRLSYDGGPAGFTPAQVPDGLKPEERQALEALALRSGRARSKTVLPRRYGDTYVVRFADSEVQVRPMGGKASAGKVSGGAVVYSAAYPQTSVFLAATDDEVEEFYYLRTSAAPREFVSELRPSGRIKSFAVTAAGNLGALDASGASVLELSRPVVIDSLGQRVFGRFALERSADATFLALSFESRGLQYPVLIDPTWRTPSTQNMSVARWQASATVLPNGKVLVVGGCSNVACGANALTTAELYDPASGSWTTTGSLISGARQAHSATLLPNGKVLIAGGNGTAAPPAYSTTELYDPELGSFAAAGVMVSTRVGHASALLNDGRVLVIGGNDGTTTRRSEIYTPATDTWATTADMITKRCSFSAIRLRDGRVLVAGGDQGAGGNSCGPTEVIQSEIFDPSGAGGAGSWTASGNLTTSGYAASMVLLTSGKVLYAGYFNGGCTAKNAQLWDPGTGNWTNTATISIRADGNSMHLLPDGRAIIIGGQDGGCGANEFSTAQIYDPDLATWSAALNMAQKRRGHISAVLPNGQVLVAGGWNGTTVNQDSQILDITAGASAATGSMSATRDNPVATLLPNGKVLIVGGGGAATLSTAELYDPAAGTFALTGAMTTPRGSHSGALLADGTVLVVGGDNAGAAALSTAEIYSPTALIFAATGSMGTARREHTSTMLPNGRVLVVGGSNGTENFSTAELYDPIARTFTATGSMTSRRGGHTATLLPNGKVLIAGGNAVAAPVSTAELYDPATGIFSATGSMSTIRNTARAILLPNGKVLIAGGHTGAAYLSTAELYDPALGTFALTGSLSQTSNGHGAVLLPSGKVMFAGGQNGGTGSITTVLLYDPATGVFNTTSPLGTERCWQGAVLLPNGKVLLAGGHSDFSTFRSSAELLRYTEFDSHISTKAFTQPVIQTVAGSSAFPVSLIPGGIYTVAGTTFTGAGGDSSRAGEGQSPAYYPRVYLMPNDSGGVGAGNGAKGLVDLSTSIYGSQEQTYYAQRKSTTTFDFKIPSDLACGYYNLFAMSNAVLSTGVAVLVAPAPPVSGPGVSGSPLVYASHNSIKVQFTIDVGDPVVSGYVVRACLDAGCSVVVSTGFTIIPSALSVTVPSLSSNTAYFFQAAAENCGGRGPFTAGIASASTLTLPPSCSVAVNVKKDGTADSTTIMGALGMLPTSLAADSCVVIRDAQTYNEQISIQGFTNNGFQLQIMGDPALSVRPAIVPALGGVALFNIANASVTVSGIRVSPTVNVDYGIYVSSPNVTITSVSVLDTMSMIDTAGIMVSSWTTVSYTSVSVTNPAAGAFWLQGSTMTTVSYSTAVNNSGTRSAVYLENARNNSFTVLFASNPDNVGIALYVLNSDTNTVTLSHLWSGSRSVEFEAGSDYNTISFSTIVGRDSFGLWINSGAASNTVTRSYMWGIANGARFDNGSNYNTISLSTIIAGSNYALSINGSDSNIVTQSQIRGGQFGAYVDAGSDYNTISFSTMIGNSQYGLYAVSADSNIVTQSYLWGGQYGIYLDAGADYNAISLSTMIGNASYGLYAFGADSNTVTQSYILGGFVGAGLEAGSNYNAISLSTMIGIGDHGYHAKADSNTVTQSYIWGGNYGAALENGAAYNAISLSTMIGNIYAGFYTGGVDSNTVTQSFMWGSQHGAYLDGGSDYNAISLSTMIGNTSNGLYAIGADSNTVTQSYMWGGQYGANVISGSDYNAISLSTMIGNANYGLYATAAASNTVTRSYMQGSTYGAYLNNGANFNTISLSTMIGGPLGGLYLFGADSNTVTQSYMRSLAYGVFLDNGSDGNAISLSTMIGNASYGFYTGSVTSNTVTQSYMWGGANGAYLVSSNYNAISLSTMVGSANNGLYLFGSDTNNVERSYMWGGNAGAYVDMNADYNTISLSTVISNSVTGAALYLVQGTSNTVHGSYVQGSTAAIVNSSLGSAIQSSVLVATSTIGTALVVQNQAFNGLVTVASTTLRGGPSGRGLALNQSNQGAVIIGSVTVTGTARGLEIDQQMPTFVLTIDSITFRGLSAGATAIHYLGGTFTSSITLANFEDTSVGANVSAAALNTLSRIYMFAHYGARTNTTYENDPSSLVFWEAGPYPGCVVTNNVGEGQTYSTIQSAINALPTTLTGRSCVVIRNGAKYVEHVSVRNFTNNGSSITIIGDPALSTRPVVAPNLGGGFAVFEIANASVVVTGIQVSPSIVEQYGIFVSSPYVTISSVSVLDPGSIITAAGIALSSWTTVSYSSVSVSHFSAAALWLQGSTMTTVAYSTAANSSNGIKPALFIDGASSSTIMGVVATNQGLGCVALRIVNGGYNSVSQSSFSSAGANCSALYIAVSSFNTVTQSFMSGGSVGVFLDAGANLNAISLSTISGNTSSGFYGNTADSNTVTQSYMWGGTYGAQLSNGSDSNTISLSTMIGNTTVGYYVNSSASNTVTQSYMLGSVGAQADSSNYTAISLSTMIGTGNYGFYVNTAISNTVTQSYMWGSSQGVYLNNGANYTAISLSTMIGNTQNGLYTTGADSNTVTQSYMLGSQRGAWLDTNSDGNSISLSTMIGSATVGLYVNAADSNTVTQSYLWGSGYGAYLDSNSDYNTISLSTMFGNSNSGLYLLGADTNKAERSYMWGGNSGAYMDMNSDYNTISLSTVISNSALNPALYFLQGTSNTVQGSYVQGSTAAIVNNSNGIAIESSVLVATSTIGSALAVQSQGINGLVTVASTTLRGGPSGRGLLLDFNNQGVVSIGSVTVTGTRRGLEISTQAAGFVLAIDSITFRGLTAGATAIHYLGGTFTSSITLANFEDTSVGANVSAAALNTLSRISMFAHYGVRTSTAYENDPNALVGWEAGPYPGCVVTRNVGAGQPFATITAGLAALPTTLTGHSCVVIRDGATYNEQVTVSGFINNSSSITIMSDPASSTVAPRVNPPPASVAAFRIINSSVNLIGLDVRPTVGPLSYGVYVSSPNVTISSVIVYDPFSVISQAGISLSSWVTVSYTSATMGNTIAFWLNGTNTTVSYSSATNSTGGGNATVQLTGASSNTLNNLWAHNTAGTAVRFDGGGGNTVSQSSFTSQNNEGLYLNGSATNTVTGTYMSSPNGIGLRLENSNRNTITQSTAASSMAAQSALYLSNSSSNSISGVFASNPSGFGAYITNSSSNTLSLSTFTSGSNTNNALYLNNGASNTITGCYFGNTDANGVGALFSNTSSNTFSQSTVVGGVGTYGLRLFGANGNRITGSNFIAGAQLTSTSNDNVITGSTFTHSSGLNDAFRLVDGSSNTISQCFMSNTLGYGLSIGGGAISNYNTVSQSTITSNVAALYLRGTGNSLVSDYVAGGTGYGAEVLNLYYSSILQSTITNNSGAFPAMYLWSSATNTITQSVIVNSNSAGNGILLDNGANWNSISQSVVKGGASGVKAQLISGLNISLSSVTGGSGVASAGVWGDIMSDYITIDNSYVQGSTGVYLNGSSRTIVTASMLAASGGGSGFYSTNNSVTLAMSANTVLGGGAAGIAIDFGGGGLIRLSTNTVISRTAQYGIAAALLSPTATLWITSNTIIPALSAAATTYGVYLELLPGGATVQNNGIYYRTAGAAFAGVGAGAYGLYATQVTGLRVDHNRISNPSMVTSGNYIGAGIDAMSSAIFKFNDLYATGSGVTTFNNLRITGSANTVVRNNILSSSMTATANRIILVDGPSRTGLSSDYNTFFSSNSSYNGYWNASQVSLLLNWITTTGGRDASTLSTNPRWVNPVGEDFHPLSRAGRWNGLVFVQDAVDGSGTDRGDTADSVDDEVEPNGARANQGSYGQTAEASQTVLPCPVTRYVKATGGDATTITDGLAALDNPLSGYSCVVIGDSRIYNEQVTVQGFTNNGSSITIMLDPALTVHPTVRSGFIIKNASVNIVNIDVIPDNGLAYGILASSANVSISSVNVNESSPGGAILTAGVALSSYSSLSYSSVAVQNAHAVRLDGKFAVVSYSTMTNSSAGFNALSITGASSNTVTGSYLSNPQGVGVYLLLGANYNTISQSTMLAGGAGTPGLYLSGSDFNAITGSYMSNPVGHGATFDGGSDNNTISQSTLATEGANKYGLYLINSDSNIVTGSYMSSLAGWGAYLDSGADYNAISLSTITSAASGLAALRLSGAQYNAVSGSYLENPAGFAASLVGGANNNTISLSTMTSNVGGYMALYITASASNTVTGSYLSNPLGYGAGLESGANYNTISQSTISSNESASSALTMQGCSFNTVTRSRITNPAGIALRLYGGTGYHTISQSTITSNSNFASALWIAESSSITVMSSYIQGSTAALIVSSTGTVISGSVLVATNTAGSALAMQGGGFNLILSSNIFIPGPQGAGVYLDEQGAGALVLSTNTIKGGQFGIYVATQQAGTALWITSNTIVPAPVAVYDSWGIFFNGLTSGATVQNNGVFYRSGGSTGANKAILLGSTDSAGLVITGNRFSNPGMVTGSAAAIYMTNTPNTVFKFNDVHSTGTTFANAFHIVLQNSPGMLIRNNVFSSSWSVTTSSSSIQVDAPSQVGFASDYNDFFSSNSLNSIQWGSATLPFPWFVTLGQDGRSQSQNPRWANPSAGAEDFHHLSQAGRWNGVSFVNDTYTSGLIDAADGAEPFANEPASNGSRPNLGSYSNTAEASKSPAPPTSPAVAGVFTSSISVSYGLVSANGYQVIASTDFNFTGTSFTSTTANGTLAALAPQSLAANTTYYLKAAAVWGDYTTFNGVTLATSTLANPAAAASPAFAEVNISSLTVSWLTNGNTVDVTTYSVVFSTGANYPNSFAGNVTQSTVPAGALPTATRTTGLAPNTTYFAFVAGINWNGVPSAYAAVGSTPTLADVPLTAVSTFSGVGFSSFTVSWSANGNPLAITTYTVTVSTAADFNAFASSFSFSTAPASGPSATFTGLGANEVYFFRARALNHQGIASAYTVLGSTLTRPVTLQAPVIAGVTTVNISSITATWGLSTLATGYTLVASLTNNPLAVFASSSPVGINATTATVFTPALNPNTTYFFFVQANGPGAATGFSAYPATSTLADLPATAVTTFTVVNLTSMTVSWLPGGNPIDVTTYTVVLSTGISYPNAFSGNRTISTMPAGAGPAASIAGLSDNTLYYLHVAAVNHNGRVSAYSALGSTVTRIAAPSTVVFDEISSNTIVASAYVATPFFSNLGVGQSGTQISRNGTYQPVHGEQWVSTTALPSPISEAGATGFNSLVYVFGGINGAAVQKSARVYDPATNLWSSLPDISSTRYGIASALAGGRIYAVGGTPDGGASLTVNEEYDPVTNTWATKAILPTPADHLSAVGVGGALYAFGGVNGGTEIDQTAQFDPAANAWTVRPIFPVTQTQMAAAAGAGPAAGAIVAAGGAGPTNSNYAYNTGANTWSAKTFMPAAVEQGAAASLGGKIYVFGGTLASQAVYEYDVAADTWVARTNMITGRAGLTAVAAGGHIYAMGGSADGGSTSLTTSEAYDPGVATKFTALSPNTLVNFRARARNQTGTLSAQTATISTYTWAALPGTVAAPFAVVEVDSVTFSWALNGNPGGTEFKTRASTSSSYGGGAAVLVSDWGAMTSTATLALTPNSTYFFSVQARNVPGITTAFVSLGSTATLAAVPTVAAVPFGNIATGGMSVSWLTNGNPVSVTTYTVVVSTEAVYPNANTGNVTVVSTQPAGALPTATLTGLVANTTYFAFASAVNWNGLRTVYASLGSTSTLALPPAANAPTYSAVQESSATFSWLPNGNPVNVTTYSVVLSTGSSFNAFAGNVVFSTTPSGAPLTATAAAGLIPNTTYFGYAAAINWNGAVSAYTALGSTATLAVLPKTAVSTFSAVFISSLTVSWNANGNPLTITSYTVTLSTASDFNAFATSVTFTTAPAAGPSATFTGLTDFTPYFFQVRAVNHGGNATAFVSLGSTTTVIAPLGVPALAGFPSVDITSITATWGLVPGATGYTFVASFLPANPPVVLEASSTTMSNAATTAAVLAPPLLPNTSYFLFVKANGLLRSSLFAAYGATSTLAAPPLTAVSTFTGVGITSFTVSWDTNGNALAITTYTVQLSTAPDFNTFATSVTFTTAPVFGPSMMLTGLSGNTSYYLRIRALNHNGVPSAFVNLGSTLTVVSPLFPSVLNSQAGDVSWRRSVGTLYQVAFLDTSGSHLDKFQVSASTTAGGLGTNVAPLTDVVIGLGPIDSYSTPWALPASVFNSLIEGVTNYITIKVFNGPPLNNFTVLQDAFYVQKDTTAPIIVNTQTGDAVARSVPGTTYTVGVRDPSSGLAAFQYSASLVAGSGNAAVIPWTDIPVVANTTSYTTPWPVNFPLLISGVTNYISVRSWDTAGATATLTDAFFVHKDTTGPSVAITAPQNNSFNSALVTFSGTAASIYGIQGTEVSVLDILSGLYWNPASVAFNSAAPVMMPAAGTTAWTLSPGIPWVNGANYRAVARSSTTANIYSATYATATFVMDLSAPTVVVQAPVPNSTVSVLPVLSGTSADPAPNPSGLSSVEVRLRRNTDGLWWNWFTQVWGPTAVSSITAGTAAWSLSPTPQLKANLGSGTSYFIAVRGSDNALPANQGDFFVSGATFTWQDVTPPAAVTDLATAHGALPGSINLSWTAPGDDGGVGSISLGEYRIFYSTDIAVVASTSTAQVIISTAGVNPGAAQFRTLLSLSPGVTYYISLALADSDGNWSAFSNQASTTAAPSPLNAITGHVLDISTQGITAVQVDCWNAADALVGTTFTLADGSGTFSVTSLPAGSYKLRVTWTVNGFSSSLWQDGIAMGSTNVDFFLNIDYALATLTGTLSSLTATSYGGPSAAGLGVASAESFIELHQQGRQVARTMVQPGGRWSIPGLLPGTYSVRAHTGLGYTAFQDVQLSEGEVRVMSFVFDPLPAASVYAFPNPARTSTTIRFETALTPLEAGIYIFDLVGNLVKEIPDSAINRAAAPIYRVVWDLNNSAGQSVAPGVYNVMVKIRGGSENQSAKVIKKVAVVR